MNDMVRDSSRSRTTLAKEIFEEELPEDCPLPNSVVEPLEAVCRFYSFPDGDPRNYFSHAKLGKPFGSAGECRGKSVSLQTPNAVENIMSAKKLQFFKAKPVALHNVPAGSGRSLENAKGHIDFWPYKGYDLYTSKVKLFATGSELGEALSDDT